MAFPLGGIMAALSKEAIQRLAVLRALYLWRKGADGPARLHKTLFAAQKTSKDRQWRLFDFKQGRLGEYSNEVASALNDLQHAGRIETIYDGLSARIRAKVPVKTRRQIDLFFEEYFTEWSNALLPAFRKWAYLNNDTIAQRAHDDAAHTKANHGEPIFSSFRSSEVQFEDLDEDLAEQLSDFVDVKLHNALRQRVALAAERPRKNEDWRRIYFGKVRETA